MPVSRIKIRENGAAKIIGAGAGDRHGFPRFDPWSKPESEPLRKELPRICAAVFEAAEMLGFKFVHGVPAHFYMEYLDPAVLQELGLSMQNANDKVADAYIRIPENPESIFRAAVERDGVPVSDVL